MQSLSLSRSAALAGSHSSSSSSSASSSSSSASSSSSSASFASSSSASSFSSSSSSLDCCRERSAAGVSEFSSFHIRRETFVPPKNRERPHSSPTLSFSFSSFLPSVFASASSRMSSSPSVAPHRREGTPRRGRIIGKSCGCARVFRRFLRLLSLRKSHLLSSVSSSLPAQRYLLLLPLCILLLLAAAASITTVFFLLTLPLRFSSPFSFFSVFSPPSSSLSSSLSSSPSYFFPFDHRPFGAPSPVSAPRLPLSASDVPWPPAKSLRSPQPSLSRFFRLASPLPASASARHSPLALETLQMQPRRLYSSRTIQVGPPETYTGFSVDALWSAFLSAPQEYFLVLWFLTSLAMFACFCSWVCEQRSFQRAVLVSP
ncbi:putative transmembrane protein [Toxoplasma gondii p89]|uniref:Putative transmembrane protein n=1 Tax=Toxoplasma gondii p89 TaxID=943119 RepID=A0A086JJD1_TOXGO|nr:putative transmembrane protein [Toxoplasma gondii p89]